MKEVSLFLERLATPHVFTVYLSPKLVECVPRVTDPNGFEPFQGKKDMESQGCLEGYKKETRFNL